MLDSAQLGMHVGAAERAASNRTVGSWLTSLMTDSMYASGLVPASAAAICARVILFREPGGGRRFFDPSRRARLFVPIAPRLRVRLARNAPGEPGRRTAGRVVSGHNTLTV